MLTLRNYHGFLDGAKHIECQEMGWISVTGEGEISAGQELDTLPVTFLHFPIKPFLFSVS